MISLALSECDTAAGLCTLLGWGPFATSQQEANATSPTNINIIPQVVNFTVLLKNAILFPVFDARFDNVGSPSTYVNLSTCSWDPKLAPTCPIFTIGAIFQQV